MNLPKNFRFSQSNLQDYNNCPKRFKLRHLQKVSWPAQETQYDKDFEIRQQLGTRFHLLIQRHISGLPKEEILENIDSPLLLNWWQNFSNFFESKFESGITFPEYALVGQIDNSPTIAKFDLVHLEDNKITIYDWKTSKKTPRRITVEEKIQTRLYLYLLSKYGHVLTNNNSIAPESISMVYWYAETPEEISFTYNEELQRSDEIYLTDLIQSIKQTPQENFLETIDKRLCAYCAYRSYCEKSNQTGNREEFEENFELDPEDFTFDIELDDLDEVFYG